MKTLKITLDTAKEMYKQCDQSIKALLLENFNKEELEEKELPKSWEELINLSGYIVYADGTVGKIENSYIIIDSSKRIWPTREYAEASLALAQLLQLRDSYNESIILKNDYDKFSIYNLNNSIGISNTAESALNFILSFKTEKLRDIYLDNFKKLIIQALPLL